MALIQSIRSALNGENLSFIPLRFELSKKQWLKWLFRNLTEYPSKDRIGAELAFEFSYELVLDCPMSEGAVHFG